MYRRGGYSEVLQSDFSCMISGEMFAEFDLGRLRREAGLLGAAEYHLDGQDAVRHLEAVCGVEEISVIQWQPGARNGPFSRWLDLLKRIQAKGVAVYVPCDTEDIKTYHRELDPSLVFYQCSAPTQQAADETLEWLVRNT